MPRVLRPLRRLVTTFFDKETLRTMAAVAEYAEAHGGELADECGESIGCHVRDYAGDHIALAADSADDRSLVGTDAAGSKVGD